MARRQRWVHSPQNQPKPRVPDPVKADVDARAGELINAVLKPAFVKPPPEEERFNYLVDIYPKWHRNYFYFCSRYRCPGPNAISPFFEDRFARLEYVAPDRYHLSYMRHTGQWWELYRDLSLEDCFAAVREEAHFWP